MTKTVALIALAAFVASSHLAGKDQTIDGRVLQGYEAAVSFLREDAQKRKEPFLLSNYAVVFEKGYRYHFYAKMGPGEKPGPGLNTDLGFTVRVYVDEKTLKVIKGVVE